VKAKQITLGEAWEEAMRIAFAMQHDKTRADAYDAETMWRNPENRTDAETSDAATKLASIGVPQEALWAFIGASPTTIARLEEDARRRASCSRRGRPCRCLREREK
jgi:hypothetical protein